LKTTDSDNRFTFRPGNSLLGRLDGIAQAFEMWRLRSFRVSYEPSAGTTVSGSIIMSIDYDVEDGAITYAQIRTQVPNIRVQVSKPGAIRFGPQEIEKVNRTRWLYTSGGTGTHPGMDAGFACNVWSTLPAAGGDIYCEYSVELTNPRYIDTVPPVSRLSTQFASARTNAGAAAPEVYSPNIAGQDFTTNAILDTITNVISSIGEAGAIPAINPITPPSGYLN
jgi:hypothetical protein